MYSAVRFACVSQYRICLLSYGLALPDRLSPYTCTYLTELCIPRCQYSEHMFPLLSCARSHSSSICASFTRKDHALCTVLESGAAYLW